MRNRKPKDSSSSSRIQEFLLVVIMLGSLLAIVALIFWWTQGLLTIETTTNNATTKGTTIDKDLLAAVLNHRKDLIAIILGAFGAWIGAGAAYFFGRENLREATSSILKMKGATPAEILMQTTVADLKPKPLPKTFTEGDTAQAVLKWLEEDPDRFFATIVDDQDRMPYAINEEAIYRYIAADRTKPPIIAADPTQPPEKVKTIAPYDKDTTIGDVVKFVKGQKDFNSSKAWQKLIDATSKVNQNSSCALADEKMAEEQKIVAIVVDDKGIPVGYITSAEIWKLVSSRTSK